MEKTDRNLEITNKKLEGRTTIELSREYKMTQANINRIVSDTKAKYPERLINYNQE